MNRNLFLRRLLKQVAFIVAVYIVIAGLVAVGWLDDYLGKIMTTASIYVIAALGLNLVTGMTGQLVLGQAGFMAIGAYCTAVLLQAGFPVLPALIVGALLAAALGLVFGFFALRLRGDYFAIVTLAFGEIIRVLLMNVDDIVGVKITGGASGMMNIRGITLPFENTSMVTLVNYLWVSLFMVLAILALVHLLTSSHGRAIVSIREDEIASEAMGINVFYTKLYAFTFSTLLAGFAGGLFACHYGYLNPDSFNWLKSMDFLIIVVFGGLGSFTGTVLASFGLVLLQEELRFLQNYRLVIYPLLLIFMMIFRPKGLLGTKELPLTATLLDWNWWLKQIKRAAALLVKFADWLGKITSGRRKGA
jgi:branched-chain amino acid transport system permease protein